MTIEKPQLASLPGLSVREHGQALAGEPGEHLPI